MNRQIIAKLATKERKDHKEYSVTVFVISFVFFAFLRGKKTT